MPTLATRRALGTGTGNPVKRETATGTLHGSHIESDPPTPRLGLITVVLATACGLAVANIYFAQPILGLLADAFHTSESSATLAVTVV